MSRFAVVAALLLAVGCRKSASESPDPDGDGVNTTDGDCAPYDALTYPGAPERCDGRDNNCDGAVDEGVGPTWYTDSDGDGFGDPSTATTACAPTDGAVSTGGDCNDRDATTHPGATESCTDPADLNCDGHAGGEDSDNDGYAACQDCDDNDADVHPGAAESCNSVDDDCNGVVDDNAPDATTFYVDLDGDSHGSDRLTMTACTAPTGFVASSDDCDDLHPNSYPGAAEDCDGLDNDCDGVIDNGATGTTTWYADADHDGYGDPNVMAQACARPSGYVDNFEDCNDADPAYNPGATESCSDPHDYNCDGAVGQTDGDNDGTPACSDCDDTNPNVHPGATEVCDGLDNDCNGQVDETAPTWYADVDGDGHGGTTLSLTQCVAPASYVASHDDCNDLNAAVAPGKAEVCDGVDDNCDGAPDAGESDADSDRFLACGGDCDDTDATVHPGGVEICDGKDQNCDGTADNNAVDAKPRYADADGDGFGAGSPSYTCATTGAAVAGDCDDAKAAVHPGATEACNGYDDDCDGAVDETGSTGTSTYYLDADGDTYGSSKVSVIACSAPVGYVSNSTDCNDLSAVAHPGATEVCNGSDDDCNGTTPANEADADADGFRGCAGDCNDAVVTIHPGAVETCNAKDDDCNGTNDDNAVDAVLWFADSDGDGFGTSTATKASCTKPANYSAAAGDCDDAKATVSPVASELCTTPTDDNCDGVANEATAIDAKSWFRDADGDGHGAPGNFTLACTQPSGRVALGDDCNDALAASYPGAAEIWYDGIDENCDGKSDYDQDGDGYESMKNAGGPDCDDTKSTVGACNASCASILANDAGAGSGPYWIDPKGNGLPLHTWCDMTRDGGGWSLVLQNNAGVSTVGSGDLSWAEATGDGSIVRAGTMTSWAGQGAFDLWVGLSDWNAIGSHARIEVGNSVNAPTRQAMYSVAIGSAASNYTLNLSNESVTVGGISPGIFTYHNGRAFTTYDRDNDVYSANCASAYNHPWWYGGCWDGSFWGSDTGSYHQAAFWTGSGSDYWNWGAIWLR